jgi:hypothetical protein
MRLKFKKQFFGLIKTTKWAFNKRIKLNKSNQKKHKKKHLWERSKF